ncbi:hypothetical protein [Flavobacterium sp. HNIBRBA15423]|uniref:hypothetical protein n=1 Tax=Flavobacterium sp. HNIBRBA15423 TaxID=3458683 RepID=UPI0040447C05
MKVLTISRILAILFFVIFIKCSSISKQNLTGTYVLKTKVGNEYIKLNRDGTFNFKSQIPLIQSESNGSWSLKNNNLILSSFLEYKNDFIEVEELTNKDKSLIQVMDKENKGMFGIIVRINDDENIFSTDINGYISLEKLELKQGDIVRINTINLSSENIFYKIKKSDKNKFIKIKIYEKDGVKRYFENDTLEIKKDKIILNKDIYKKSE